MRRILIPVLFTPLLSACARSGNEAPSASPPPSAWTEQGKQSYSLGYVVGSGVRQEEIPFDEDALTQGLRDGMTDAPAQYTDEQVTTAMLAYRQQYRLDQMAKRRLEAARAQAQGQVFLKTNRTKPEFTTLESGLQYRIVKEGTGTRPGPSDRVRVRYLGKLLNGAWLQDPVAPGQAVVLPVNQMLPGLSQALQLMPAGSHWEVVLPPELAFGSNPPPGQDIPPGSVVVYNLELLAVEPSQ